MAAINFLRRETKTSEQSTHCIQSTVTEISIGTYTHYNIIFDEAADAQVADGEDIVRVLKLPEHIFIKESRTAGKEQSYNMVWDGGGGVTDALRRTCEIYCTGSCRWTD
jgi:hypothetical protein